jgi:hypothetical protein
MDLRDLPAGYYLLGNGRGILLPLVVLPAQNR